MSVYVFRMRCSYLGGTAVVVALTERRARTIAERAAKDAGFTPEKDHRGNAGSLIAELVESHSCDAQGLAYFWDGDY